MEFFSIVAIVFIGLLISLILKNYNPVFKVFVTVITGVVVLYLSFPFLKEVVEMTYDIASMIDSSNFFIKEISKIISIAYFAEIASAICNDSGESALAEKINLAGKIIILYTGHPIILSLLDIVVSVSIWR